MKQKHLISFLVFVGIFLLIFVTCTVSGISARYDANRKESVESGKQGIASATDLISQAEEKSENVGNEDNCKKRKNCTSVVESTGSKHGIEANKKSDTLTKDDKKKRKKYGGETSLPKIVSIKMENINQFPELPTGCESVALTMLLNYYGFNLDKTTIADEYLIYSDNFVIGYTGNPHSYDGGGCYAPGMTKTANAFLDENDSNLTAMNITGSKPEDIYRWVANDCPVLIWNTVNMLENQPSGVYEEYRGRTYQWDRCEHCMVMCGYDFTKKTVLINDPIDGIIERDAEQFWKRYENLGSMAIIIE